MKKVIVATILKVCNYGTALQVYATQTILQKLGFNVEILNYKQKRLENNKLLFKSDKAKTTIKNRIYRILSIIYRMIPNIIIKNKFEKFLTQYINLTPKECTSFEEVNDNYINADAYITGSDQVWNSNYNEGIDKVYYLDFVPNNVKKISYAASIGMDNFKEEEKENIQMLLKKYNSISVRELSAKSAIKNLGLKVQVVLDPTLLIPRQEWINISNKKVNEEKYLLLYILGRDKTLLKYAQEIAKGRNLKIVKVGLDFIHSKIVNKSYSYATPNDFISLFINASYIITNSFHGIAFAINFNKQFIAIPPKSYQTRLNSILSLFDLEDRMIVNQKLINLKDIDYGQVNQKLDKMRNSSINFLRKSLGENNE